MTGALGRLVRVLIGDDHPMYRRSVAALIEDHPELDLVGQAEDGEQVLALVETERPDVALIDVRMPRVDGLGVLSLLRANADAPAVVLLSALTDSATVHQALEGGAAGFLSKDAGEEEIGSALIAVAREGRTVVSSGLQEAVFAHIRRRGVVADLSPREREILRLIADGVPLAVIGDRLSLSPATVKTYLRRAYEKLGVSDRAAAVAEALRRGLLR